MAQMFTRGVHPRSQQPTPGRLKMGSSVLRPLVAIAPSSGAGPWKYAGIEFFTAVEQHAQTRTGVDAKWNSLGAALKISSELSSR
jgi:hypothetical protein